MSTDRVRRSHLVLWAGLLLGLDGCVTTPAPLPVAQAPPLPHVKVGGAGLLADDVQQSSLTREELVVRVGDLLSKEHPAAARRLIERYPDVSLEVLRAATCEQARSVSVQAIARVFDEQCVRTESAAGWSAVLRERIEHPERFTAYDTARARLVTVLNSGRPKDAADVSLPSPPKGAAEVLLSIDSDQLTARALMLANRATDAVQVLTQAAKASHAGYPYQEAQMLFALAQAWRHAGQEENAVSVWRAAVEQAAALLTAPHPVNDPILWEHLSAARPLTTPWPAVVGEQLAHRLEDGTARDQSPVAPVAFNLTASEPALADEGSLWSEVGQWRLKRGESQAALLAFRRAEAAASDEPGKEQLRLAQVRALLQMDQKTIAMDILVHLALVPSSSVAKPALAMLGAIKFQDGAVQQSLAILKKAVEENAESKWPGRSEAEADLGLAYLTTGNETEGLRWLHTAQQHFEQGNDRTLLRQCLENEAAYHEHAGRQQEAITLRQREKSLEREE